ncbi:hypothetical protein C8R44DRAFT_747760 [Mycena epipterygia]|nr:hypothetical protein C8R44DRAFT_747760 [Mycena epipterygia]
MALGAKPVPTWFRFYFGSTFPQHFKSLHWRAGAAESIPFVFTRQGWQASTLSAAVDNFSSWVLVVNSVDTWALVNSRRDADCNLIFAASIENPCISPATPPCNMTPPQYLSPRRPLEENCNVHLLKSLANRPHHRSSFAIPGARDACVPHQLGLQKTETTGTHAEYMYMYTALYFLLSSSSGSPYDLSVHANEGGWAAVLTAFCGERFLLFWTFRSPASILPENFVLFLLPGNLLFDANPKVVTRNVRFPNVSRLDGRFNPWLFVISYEPSTKGTSPATVEHLTLRELCAIQHKGWSLRE